MDFQSFFVKQLPALTGNYADDKGESEPLNSQQ